MHGPQRCLKDTKRIKKNNKLTRPMENRHVKEDTTDVQNVHPLCSDAPVFLFTKSGHEKGGKMNVGSKYKVTDGNLPSERLN